MTPNELKVNSEIEAKKIQKIQKNLMKRYNGAAGAKRFEKDAQEQTLNMIEEFKEFNAEKENFKPLFKAADSWIKKDERTGPRLKNITDWKKEFEVNFKKYQKQFALRRLKTKEDNEKSYNILDKIVPASPNNSLFETSKDQEMKRIQEKQIIRDTYKITEKKKSPKNLSWVKILFGIILVLPIFYWGWKRWH